jgi:hypothetical protein
MVRITISIVEYTAWKTSGEPINLDDKSDKTMRLLYKGIEDGKEPTHLIFAFLFSSSPLSNGNSTYSVPELSCRKVHGCVMG